jgi:hypothetical protein
MKIPRMSFNTGEIAPVLWYRSDLQKYANSCQRLENYINMPQGGIRRRFGSEVVARIGDNDTENRIIVWEVDRGEYFQLIFLGTEIQIYDSNGAKIYTVETIPWAAADFGGLYIKQVFDVMYIAHPNYPLKVISRTSLYVWEITDHEFLGGPFLDQNTDTTSTVAYSWLADVVTITASDAIFKASDVGRLFKVRGEGAGSDSDNYGTGAVGTTSNELAATGIITLRTEGGIWEGVLTLQESIDGGTTWDDIGSIISKDGKHNGEIERDITGFGSLVRVEMTERASAPSDSGCIWTLEIAEVQNNYVTITGFTDANIVTGTLQGGLTDAVTTYAWTFGVFGEDEGYPTCVEIYEERLMLAGVLSKPSTVYGSRINDWVIFQEGTFATSPIVFSLAADVRNRIRWMVPEQELILGTDYGEWTIGTRDSSTALSGENVSAKRQTQFGTEPIQPVISADMTLYIEAGGKRMRSIQYNYEKDGYVAADMTVLAPHLTEDFEITRMTFSRSPDQIVWAVRADGQLLAFTYEREHGVSAWSRHPFSDNGSVTDINSILTNDGDVMSMLVNRSDGLYFEIIRQDSLCFDWARHYTDVVATDVITLIGNESSNFYNEALVKNSSHFEAKESGIYVHLDTVVTALVINYDSVQLDINEDFISMGNDLYWIPAATDKGLVTVFDGITALVENTDFTLDTHTETYVVDLLSGLYEPEDLTVLNNAVPLVVNVDYWIMSGAEQILIIGMDGVPIGDITVEKDAVPLTTADYVVIVPKSQVASIVDTSFYVAISMESIVETTDIMNFPDQGGPGTRNKVNEVDCFVVNSVGGEVSANGGQKYNKIKQTSKTVIAGQRIESYTGKLEVRVQHGYQDHQTISFKNDTPYNQIVAALGIKAQRTSD